MTEDEISERAAAAEGAIQKILLNLQEETGKRIYSVRVDVRNYANLSTDICFEG